ncbi:hypothetical protein MVEN_01706000 [Mycena venus]|uniref:DUF6535 domain-containing protein n=1 Tax=Mycena venus TaxID=2733690 RepID=A0A8H7CQV1_9AGAR|nr:hypothetical protein MVEN_01706000 [Mycena venus]
MGSPKKVFLKPQISDHDDEAAGGKMWAVYVTEAEKYDRALVESWKSDMEGMLIFAGLFSASVVAFLIESYKTLIPDSGDTTILLLTQISNQLAAAANGTSFTITSPGSFTPQTSALVCNTLWFISLGLSLTCALVATLVEQWAREFMHKADMRSAPAIRARVFSYLYYGLKRFKMHTVVGVIPLLLHTSLLFFFAGLVAFLIPVNIVVTLVTAILLFILAAVYLLLTSLPLVYVDCPYQTPLSGALWQLKQKIPRIKQYLGRSSETLSKQMTSQTETMVEAMFQKARSDSLDKMSRDKNALVWTMKSLADDTELEPFIEAIPDILWGFTARRSTYKEHIEALINNKDPHVRLLERIHTLYTSCDTGLLTAQASSRRKISCYQATWAIGSLTTPSHFFDITLFNHIANASHGNSDDRVVHYSLSAVAMSRWASFCAAQNLLKETQVQLNACNSGIRDSQGQSTIRLSQQKLLYCLQSLKLYSIILHHPDSLEELSLRLNRITEEFGDPYTTVPFRILIDYLSEASQFASPPFRFEETQKCISPPKSDIPLTRRWLADLEGRLERIIYDHMYKMNTNKDSIHWLDGIVSTMMSYWVPPEAGTPTLPQSFLHYLNHRTSEAAVKVAMDSLQIGRRGKRFLPATIMRITRALSRVSDDITGAFYIQKTEKSLTDLWAILSRVGLGLDLPQMELIINEVSHIDYPLMTPSIVSIAKHKAVLLHAGALQSGHPFLPEETATAHLDEDHALKHRQDEAHLEILSNFIQQCHQAHEPLFKGRETLEILGSFTPGWDDLSYIHHSHQLHFAEAVESLVTKVLGDSDTWCAELMQVIPGFPLFTAYTPQPFTGYGSIWTNPSPPINSGQAPTPPWIPGYGPMHPSSWVGPGAFPGSVQPTGRVAQWLTSVDACRSLKRTFERYAAALPSEPSNYSLVSCIQGIIGALMIDGLSTVPEDPSASEGSPNLSDTKEMVEESVSHNSGSQNVTTVMAQNERYYPRTESDTTEDSFSIDSTDTETVSDESDENNPTVLWPYAHTYPPGFVPQSFIPVEGSQQHNTPFIPFLNTPPEPSDQTLSQHSSSSSTINITIVPPSRPLSPVQASPSLVNAAISNSPSPPLSPVELPELLTPEPDILGPGNSGDDPVVPVIDEDPDTYEFRWTDQM